MYHMKRASVRDLRYDFPKVEKMLAEGESIEITKRNQVIGTLTPPNIPAKVEFPDFMSRLKKIYGSKVLRVSGAELIRRDRDRSTGSLR
jgi:antitoxin (DNA-binding transcriptional repressor) of toxin-antitoxin stability system